MKPLLFFIAGLLCLTACESDFDPTAPAGSTPYIMCVLNPKDSAQYVRIQKSYICQENAYNFANRSDSLYYPEDQLEVLLVRFDTLDGSIMGEPIRLYPTRELVKDSGDFTPSGHYLFKTTEAIHAEFDYELRVKILNEGKTVTSRIQPLGSWNIDHAFNGEQRKTRYNWYLPERIDYWMDLTPNSHQQLSRFLYLEEKNGTTSRKYIEFYYNYDEFENIGEGFGEQTIIGDDFLLRFIARELPVTPGVKRYAVGVDFMITIADSSLLLYEKMQNPDTHFLYVQDFNNIRGGGTGLLASRYKLTLFGKAFKPEELDSLSRGKITRQLNFADSRGEFHGGGY